MEMGKKRRSSITVELWTSVHDHTHKCDAEESTLNKTDDHGDEDHDDHDHDDHGHHDRGHHQQRTLNKTHIG